LLIRLEPGAAVEGTVIDDQGAPVVGASIYVNFDVNLDDGGLDYLTPERAAVTNSEGSFYVDSLVTAPTTLYVQHPSFAPASERVTPVQSRPTRVRIVMNAGGAIQGTVWWNGAPVRGKDMMMLNADGMNVQTGGAATDADGRYRIDHLPPGEYAVYTGVAEGFFRSQRRLVEVVQGSTTQLDFSSPAVPGILEGSVLLDGQTPANLGFQLSIETDFGQERLSNAGWIKNGSYLTENLPAGWATLSITAIDANRERVGVTEEFEIAEGATLRRDFDLQTP
jgi:hypothetical protein